MKQTFGWVLLLAAVSTVAADDSKKTDSVSREAVEILRKSEAALKTVKKASYSASYRGTRWVESMVPKVEGIATIGTRSQWDIDPFSCEVTITPNDSEETLTFAAGSNGDTYFLIDSKTKTVYEDMDPLVLGSNSRNIQRVLMHEFAMPDPFGDALTADTVQLKGDAEVNGEVCYVVRAEGESPPSVSYYIAKKDYLPRRVVRTYKNPKGEEGSTELTISHLKINPSFVRDPFAVVVPKGYKKTDDFAP